MTPNPVRWFEIYVQDMPRALRFYESVFATKLEQLPAGDLEMWAFPQKMGLPGAAGGKLYRDKIPIGPYGFIVLAQDPDGNMFGIHSTR